MKVRFEGAVNGAHYEVRGPNGAVLKRIPMAEAQDHPKLAAAIRRNGWETL